MNFDELERIGSYKDGRIEWSTNNRSPLVYLICFDSELIYIGSTTNLRRRFSQYIADLTHDKYDNLLMQEAFNRYEEFIIYCLEWVDVAFASINLREQFFINIIAPSLNIRAASSCKEKIKRHISEGASSTKERVKNLLKERGMTAKELASKMNISEGALSLSLSGNPTLSRLQEIAQALGVEVVDLFVSPSNVLTCPKCGAKLKLTQID